MKTTIDLPDDLFRKTKVLAAERRTTLKDLVIQGLEMVIRAPSAGEEHERREALALLLGKMKAANTEPMRPLTRAEIYER